MVYLLVNELTRILAQIGESFASYFTQLEKNFQINMMANPYLVRLTA